MTKSLKEFNFLKIKIMKRINKMNESNVVNSSKVTAELVKPEITGHATSNFETTFPIPKIGEVKMKIDVTSTVTSSIAAQEKLDELAEKKANRALENIGKFVGLVLEKSPEIFDMLRNLSEKNEQYKEKFREKQSLEEWDEKVDNLLFLLRQKSSSMTNLEFLEEMLENGDYESQKISKWAILQFNKNNLGLLNEKQKESLASIGFIGY